MGYTNAGKSSLLHALCGTGEDLGVDDRLFATLDPTLRWAQQAQQAQQAAGTVRFAGC